MCQMSHSLHSTGLSSISQPPHCPLILSVLTPETSCNHCHRTPHTLTRRSTGPDCTHTRNTLAHIVPQPTTELTCVTLAHNNNRHIASHSIDTAVFHLPPQRSNRSNSHRCSNRVLPSSHQPLITPPTPPLPTTPTPAQYAQPCPTRPCGGDDDGRRWVRQRVREVCQRQLQHL